MTNLKHLTKKELKEWLATKTPNDIIGTTGAYANCPVVGFYREKGLTVEVTESYIDGVINGTFEGIETKSWLHNFITKLDKTHKNCSVTASQVLKIADKI